MSMNSTRLNGVAFKEMEELPLVDDESDYGDERRLDSRRRDHGRGRTSYCGMAFRCLAICFALTAAFVLGHISYKLEKTTPLKTDLSPSGDFKAPHTRPVSLGKCSPDWREAKAQGCVYDFILSTWMHTRCFNGTMHEHYKGIMKWKNLTFWREPAMVHEMPFEEAASGEHEGYVWTQGSEHHLHCSYVWDRIRYASKRTPFVLDSLCRDDEHIDHCIFYNGVPFGWEVDAPNVTRIYNEPYLVDCLVG